MRHALFAVVLLAMAGTVHAQGLTVTTDGFEEGVNQSINQGEAVRRQRETEARARAEAHRREHPELYQNTPGSPKSTTSSKADSAKRQVESTGVQGIRKADYLSNIQFFRITCNSGRSTVAGRRPDGYWVDSGFNNRGERYRSMSQDEFASEWCR